MDINRRGWIGGAAAWMAMNSVPVLARDSVVLRIDARGGGRRVNPLVYGNNVDWSYSAQGAYVEGTQNYSPGWLDLADRIAPTVLRYPGGTNSDFYRWKAGLGPLASRGSTRTLEGKDERVNFGTDEFLALCKRWRCEPLITINLATASADEAADWVRYTNRRDNDLPRVQYWEIGNEPYLEAHFPQAKMRPVEFAKRAAQAIRAMKAVDPSIQCGIPLRSDTLGPASATPFKGFNDDVLGALDAPFEWAALHSSYFPVTFEKKESREELFLATMAGTRVIEQDLHNTRATLHRHRPSQSIPIAFTEYNALYSLDILRFGLAAVFLSSTDRYIESLAGALYTADALRLFSQTDDLLMANFWSMSGNWWYGAIGHDGKPRPQFHVLEAWRDFRQGTLLPVTGGGMRTMRTPRAGFVPAFSDVDQIASHAVRGDDGVLRVALINRHPREVVALDLQIDGARSQSVLLRQLGADDYFDREVSWRERTQKLDAGGRLLLSLPKHSFTALSLPLS